MFFYFLIIYSDSAIAAHRRPAAATRYTRTPPPEPPSSTYRRLVVPVPLRHHVSILGGPRGDVTDDEDTTDHVKDGLGGASVDVFCFVLSEKLIALLLEVGDGESLLQEAWHLLHRQRPERSEKVADHF